MKKIIVTVLLAAVAAVNACTVWIIAPDSTQSGGYIIHKTRDRSIWRKLLTRLRWLPEEEGKFRVLEFGDFMYMNEKGLFIFNTNIPKTRDATKEMYRILTLMQDVARACHDIDSAEKMMREYVTGGKNPWHSFYIVSDHTGAIMVEMSPTGFASRRIEKGFAVHSNHFVFPEMAYLNNCADGATTVPSATRLEVTRNEIARMLGEKGKLSEMDSLEISRFAPAKYPNMCPFRDTTICGADYIPDSEFPSLLGTLLVTPGPPFYAPAMSIPICIGNIPEPLENGDLGKLAYQVKEYFPKNVKVLDRFRELEKRLRAEYLECLGNARKLIKEGKTDEAKKLLDENVAAQSKAVHELFKDVLKDAPKDAPKEDVKEAAKEAAD